MKWTTPNIRPMPQSKENTWTTMVAPQNVINEAEHIWYQFFCENSVWAPWVPNTPLPLCQMCNYFAPSNNSPNTRSTTNRITKHNKKYSLEWCWAPWVLNTPLPPCRSHNHPMPLKLSPDIWSIVNKTTIRAKTFIGITSEHHGCPIHFSHHNDPTIVACHQNSTKYQINHQ
jgi:hypothetical protein